MKGKWLRPAVHAGMLGFAALTPILGRWGMAGVAGAAVLVNLFILSRTAFGKSLARPGEERFGGLVTYPLAVSLLFVLFPPWAAVLGWAVLALGDPAATMIGGRTPPGVRRLPWNRRKSLDGSVAFAAAALFGAHLVATLLGPALVLDPSVAIPAVAAAALAGTLVEGLPLPLDDNLPVALAAGAAAAGVPRLLAGLHGGG